MQKPRRCGLTSHLNLKMNFKINSSPPEFRRKPAQRASGCGVHWTFGGSFRILAQACSRPARAESVTSQRRLKEKPLGRWELFSPLTPALSPLRGEGGAGVCGRRAFLRTTAKGISLTALFAGLPEGWLGTAYADDSPETAALKFGIIALTDCSPIVIAHEKGLFKKYGIDSTVTKGANWAAIRDNLSSGTIQATHMLIGMPIASTMGLAGSPKKPMIIPWLLNRNGQAISLKTEWKGKVGADPKALVPFVKQAQNLGEPLTFAMTFPPGTHAMWMRYYLGAGGINPDKDVSLITVPPAQMVSNMKIGKMDGFCVGEPWNARAIADGIGFTSVTTQDMWKDHPEKVCAFTADFADKNPKSIKACLKALHEASVWLDDMNNRPEQCDLVSKPTYINCDKAIL